MGNYSPEYVLVQRFNHYGFQYLMMDDLFLSTTPKITTSITSL